MSATVKKTGPGLAKLKESIERIKNSDVLVGIPAERTQRKNDPINNASLLFIHTHGSPLKNIPPRPVLQPSIALTRKLFTPHLEAAAKLTLDHKPEQAERELNLAGVIAVNGAKRYVLQGRNLAPNAPSTIKRKGSDRPLVDTNQMIGRALTYVVRTNKTSKGNS